LKPEKQARENLKQNWVFYLKCFVKIKTGGLLLTFMNKNLEILAQTRSYFSILIFGPPIVAFHFFDWTKITVPPLVLFIELFIVIYLLMSVHLTCTDLKNMALSRNDLENM
jgi:hypothetical protein